MLWYVCQKPERLYVNLPHITLTHPRIYYGLLGEWTQDISKAKKFKEDDPFLTELMDSGESFYMYTIPVEGT